MAVAAPERPVEVVGPVAKKVRIQVTREDLLRGRRSDGSYCPVALALRRTGVEFNWVSCISIVRGPIEYLLPWEAQFFIFEYDQGSPVEPFEFDLEVPS